MSRAAGNPGRTKCNETSAHNLQNGSISAADAVSHTAESAFFCIVHQRVFQLAGWVFPPVLFFLSVPRFCTTRATKATALGRQNVVVLSQMSRALSECHSVVRLFPESASFGHVPVRRKNKRGSIRTVGFYVTRAFVVFLISSSKVLWSFLFVIQRVLFSRPVRWMRCASSL